MLKKVSCSHCREFLILNKLDRNSFIQAKNYSANKKETGLLQPNKTLCAEFFKVEAIFMSKIKVIAHQNNLVATFKKYISKQCSFMTISICHRSFV